MPCNLRGKITSKQAQNRSPWEEQEGGETDTDTEGPSLRAPSGAAPGEGDGGDWDVEVQPGMKRWKTLRKHGLGSPRSAAPERPRSPRSCLSPTGMGTRGWEVRGAKSRGQALRLLRAE